MSMKLRYVGFSLVAIWAVLTAASMILAAMEQPFEGLPLFAFALLFVGCIVLLTAAAIDRLKKRDEY